MISSEVVTVEITQFFLGPPSLYFSDASKPLAGRAVFRTSNATGPGITELHNATGGCRKFALRDGTREGDGPRSET